MVGGIPLHRHGGGLVVWFGLVMLKSRGQLDVGNVTPVTSLRFPNGSGVSEDEVQVMHSRSMSI